MGKNKKIPFSRVYLTKSSDRCYACTGEAVTYDIRIENTGQTTIENAVFYDSLPDGLNYAKNSLVCDGKLLDKDPRKGVFLGDIPPQKTLQLCFNVEIGEVKSDRVSNHAVLYYDRLLKGEGVRESGMAKSNILKLRLLKKEECISSSCVAECVSHSLTSLAHRINAEGEKVQKILHHPDATKEQLSMVLSGAKTAVCALKRFERTLSENLKNWDGDSDCKEE